MSSRSAHPESRAGSRPVGGRPLPVPTPAFVASRRHRDPRVALTPVLGATRPMELRVGLRPLVTVVELLPSDQGTTHRAELPGRQDAASWPAPRPAAPPGDVSAPPGRARPGPPGRRHASGPAPASPSTGYTGPAGAVPTTGPSTRGRRPAASSGHGVHPVAEVSAPGPPETRPLPTETRHLRPEAMPEPAATMALTPGQPRHPLEHASPTAGPEQLVATHDLGPLRSQDAEQRWPSPGRPSAAPRQAAVRRGSEAERLTRTVQAEAATVDGVVYLPDRHGALDSPTAAGLLAHELVHAGSHEEQGAAGDASGATVRDPASPSGRDSDQQSEEGTARRVEEGVRAGLLQAPRVQARATPAPTGAAEPGEAPPAGGADPAPRWGSHSGGEVHRASVAPPAPDDSGGRSTEELDGLYRLVVERLRDEELLVRERTGRLTELVWG